MIITLEKYGTVRYDEPLKNHCTWRIGGPADALIEPTSKEKLVSLVEFLTGKEIPWLVIGAGSKLLFDDKGFRGVIIKVAQNLSKVSIVDDLAICEAGNWMPCLALKLGQAGLSGIEHTIGIPGNLGGLVAMNGGSRRKAIGNNIEYVEAINSEGKIIRLTNKDSKFGYRSSVYLMGDLVIVEVCLRLNKKAPSEIRKEMLAILKERRIKFPLKQPSCGSVFLSNPNTFEELGSPGAILEKLGFKGFRIGGAQVSEKHANFIINTGNATAKDVLELVSYLQEIVKKQCDVALHCELRYVSQNYRL
jgi:UDP-N-acetylmuramate dehydrogenase